MPAVDVPRKVVAISRGSDTAERLHEHARVLARLKPWAGHVPKGYQVDFLGALTNASFRVMWGADPAASGGTSVETSLPTLSQAEEGWFEAANWAAAARDARGRFVMITLGACYGTQAVGSYLALKQLNPMPSKLVAVEAEPGNFAWLREYFKDNGIDPDEHWLLQAAVSESNDPVLFPVGASGLGANNCMWTNSPSEREVTWRELMNGGRAEDALRRLLTTNSTGLRKPIDPNRAETIEIRYVSAVTVADILAPFDFIDYLETDLQSAEVAVLPPAMDSLRRKVRRIHVGTHSQEGHRQLHRAFARGGWTRIFDYEPYTTYETPLGTFSTDDGLLTFRNPLL